MNERVVYAVGAVVFLTAAIFSLGYHHFDEHFQILEFAGLKLGITQAHNLPWEYRSQIRPAVQPAMVVSFHYVLGWLGIESPFTITTLLRIVSAAISFLAVLLLYRAYRPEIKDAVLRQWFLLLSFFLWFAVYNNVRFSSENWSGTVFLMAFSLFFIKRPPDRWHYFLIGLMCGLAFVLRYQVGLLVAGFWLWLLFIRKEKIRNLAIVLSGAVIITAGGILIDRWFYGEWTLTAWNYLEQNILLDRASGFGTAPWWYYLEVAMIKAVPPISLVLILAVMAVFLFRSKDALTWTVLPFLLIHFIIGHKELRFMFPIIGFLPIFVVKAVELVRNRQHYEILNNKIVRIFVRAVWAINTLLLLVVIFRPADYQISLYRTIFDTYSGPVTLSYMDANPYHRILDIHYYKRDNVQIRRIDSINDIHFNNGSTCLFVTKNPQILNEVEFEHEVIYTSFPEWIRHFDFNNWIERTKFWYVYELRPKVDDTRESVTGASTGPWFAGSTRSEGLLTPMRVPTSFSPR